MMNKIKRKYIEDLYHSVEVYNQEFNRDKKSEAKNKAFHTMFELDGGLHDFLEREKAFFVSDLVRCFVYRKMSISRLLKCLEVCGIEVVEE